jgi:four helix bundle protein
MTPEELSDRLLTFAVRIGKIVDVLPDTRVGRHVAGQIVRCGTSPGPNYEEGCAAESRKDFAHKLSIALKELRETKYWLRFIVKAELLQLALVEIEIDEVTQLAKIIGKSIVTVKNN